MRFIVANGFNCSCESADHLAACLRPTISSHGFLVVRRHYATMDDPVEFYGRYTFRKTLEYRLRKTNLGGALWIDLSPNRDQQGQIFRGKSLLFQEVKDVCTIGIPNHPGDTNRDGLRDLAARYWREGEAMDISAATSSASGPSSRPRGPRI